jgi:DNA-3-methyladenine glycosylase II
MNQLKIKRHLDALAQRDSDLQRGLRLVRYPAPRIREQGFETFLSTIVSQQISTEAAAAIMRVRSNMSRAWRGQWSTRSSIRHG